MRLLRCGRRVSTGSSSLLAFWSTRRAEAPELPVAVPAAWAFGATPAQADRLLELVLRGIKTATASSMWDHDAAGEAPPEVGDLSVVLDGAGEPRAVIETVALQILPFHEVDVDHAHAEGEGDRTLGHWRAAHERWWRQHSESPRGFEPDMPVLCERFMPILASVRHRRSVQSSDLSRHAKDVFAAAEQEPLEVTRRDGAPLVLTTKERSDDDEGVLDIAAQLIAAVTVNEALPLHDRRGRARVLLAPPASEAAARDASVAQLGRSDRCWLGDVGAGAAGRARRRRAAVTDGRAPDRRGAGVSGSGVSTS